MTPVLCAVYFVSGASALIFEVLWFHQAGLAFGNSVWATSLVLTGFMAGLAIGNALAARYGDRVDHPIRLYVLMELIIALTGVGLIYLLPVLGSALAPLLSRWVDQPLVINPIRLLLGFILLLIPSTAMGVTLPLLTKALMPSNTNFGSVLGNLYGWNTLGAVTGVTISEICLIEYLGIHGTGLLAGGLDFVAASIAMWFAHAYSDRPSGLSGVRREPVNWLSGSPWLLAVFLSGFCLLALEVVWFRFLSLFVLTTTLAFALMLAIVLAGIGTGGLAGSFWLTRNMHAHRHGGDISFMAGVLCVACYAGFSGVAKPYGIIHNLQPAVKPLDILCIGIPLMLPVSFVSGVFFILMGAALRQELKSEMRTAGALTMVNTIGAALGSFLGGFLLLPKFGMERSFFLIALVYGSVGVLLLFRNRFPLRSSYGAAGVFVVALGLFPFGLMKERYLRLPPPLRILDEIPSIAAIREGLAETIIYIKIDWHGKTVGYKMITNAFTMSATALQMRRYMKLYVYWPVAVHPKLEKALLISYGVGSTAKALVDTRSIKTIDIVDISRDILEMNSIVYPHPADQPLRDPRVRVHVEDGRYFLQTTDQRFDLITADPPPPAAAGVVNLYTREYFELMRRRLADGGMVTYWLPVHILSAENAKSVLTSFCQVFADCSLWTGSGPELIMVGTRNAQGPVSEELFTRQWKDPIVRDEMKDLGFEKPEQLGALFIGDADYLLDFLRDTPPLVDNYPKRILASGSAEGNRTRFLDWTNTAEARGRFVQSPWIKRIWPPSMRTASLPYFEFQDSLNDFLYIRRASTDLSISHVHQLLTRTRLETPAAWFLGCNADMLNLLKSMTPAEMDSPVAQYLLGVRALSRRNYAEAVEPFRRAEGLPGLRQGMFQYRIYALCMAGQVDRAQRLVQEMRAEQGPIFDLFPFWQWMKKTFPLDPLAGHREKERSRSVMRDL